MKQIVIILSLLQLSLVHALEREKSVENCAGEVVSLQGSVLVRNASETVNPKGREPASLKPGSNVYPGDVINTSSDGAVKILLKDKTIVDIGPSALFQVAQFKKNEGQNREAELDMMFGKMRVAVPSKITGKGYFKIKTKAATMGVRGTEFVVSTALDLNESKVKTAPKTDITVLQGKVDVMKAGESAAAASASAPIHLAAGNQMSTQMGLAAVPVKLNDSQLANVSASSKVKDNTFRNAVTIESNPDSRSSSSSSSSTAANSSSSSTRTPASSSSSSTSSTSATAAVAALANIAAAAPVVPISFSNIGVPGAPSVVNVVNPATQSSRSYHVTVVVTQ